MWILIREQVREKRGSEISEEKKKKKENLRRLTVSGSPTNHIYDCMRRGILVYGTSTRIDIVIFTSPRENLLIFTTKRNNKVYLLPRRNNTIIQTVFPKFGKAYRIFFGWLDAKWLEDTREGGKERERERERELVRPWNRERYQFLIWWNITSLQCEFHVTWNKSEIWKIPNNNNNNKFKFSIVLDKPFKFRIFFFILIASRREIN